MLPTKKIFSSSTPLTGKLKRTWLRLKYLLYQRRRHNAVVLEQIGRFHFLVLPSVMNPVLFLTGKWFVEQLSAELIPHGSHVLDMGCGSGVVGVFASQWAEWVISADVNPSAVRCATINSLLNQCEHTQTAIESDLFSALSDQQFDVILFNPPFFRGDPTAGFDQAWRSNDVVERFADQLHHHLRPNGYALLLLSTNGDKDGFLHTFATHNYKVKIVIEEQVAGEILTIFKVTP